MCKSACSDGNEQQSLSANIVLNDSFVDALQQSASQRQISAWQNMWEVGENSSVNIFLMSYCFIILVNSVNPTTNVYFHNLEFHFNLYSVKIWMPEFNNSTTTILRIVVEIAFNNSLLPLVWHYFPAHIKQTIFNCSWLAVSFWQWSTNRLEQSYSRFYTPMRYLVVYNIHFPSLNWSHWWRDSDHVNTALG